MENKKLKAKNFATRERMTPLTIVMLAVLGIYCAILIIWLF